MKVLITGANGFLGQHLIRLLLEQTGCSIVAAGRGESRLPFRDARVTYCKMNLAEPVEVYAAFDTYPPDVVVHAGAMTQVDECENNSDEAFRINVGGTTSVIVSAEKHKSFLIFVSTDFVFDGKKGNYSEEDENGFVNWYGQTKGHAENLVKQSETAWSIIRTCLVYGNAVDGRSNITSWVKESLEQNKKINVVNDQFRTPTYVEDLAKGILLVIQKKAKGIYHISGEEVLTPYEMALQVAGHLSLDKALIEKTDASSFKQTAARPARTGFDISKAKKELGYLPIPFSEGLKKMYG